MIKRFSLAVIMLGMLLTACGGDSEAPDIDIAQYLPERFDNLAMERTSEIETYVGTSLWEYINGGAELYHLYGFVEVATADYQTDGIELVVDIYGFDSPKNAYGLYSQLRQPDNTILELGMEGFAAPASLNFAKGSYLVRITGYEEADGDYMAMINLGEELSRLIPGRDKLPEMFAVFPEENARPGSNRYFAESFLGHKFLTDIYSREYILESDTVTLFIAPDSNGARFAEWMEYAEKTDRKQTAEAEIGYDEGYYFIFSDSYYGDIIVGLKSGRLAGMVGYSKSQKSLLNSWLPTI